MKIVTVSKKHVSCVHHKEAYMATEWQLDTQISLWFTSASGVYLSEIDQLLIQLFGSAHSFQSSSSQLVRNGILMLGAMDTMK
jgi:hypothetical protein